MQNNDKAGSKAQTVTVSDGENGQRIDNFLLRRAHGVPRSHIYRIIRTGQVRVNSGRIKPTRKLQSGDLVRIPPMHLAPARDRISVPDKLANKLAASVIVEHMDFIAINKPAGIAVHAGTGLAFGAIDAIRQQRKDSALELVHRLDRGTSGCLLIARDIGRNRQLQELFRTRKVRKHYVAIVQQQWSHGDITVDAPLSKNVEHAGERRVMVDKNGSPSVSHFSCVEQFPNASLVQIRIETGRTHQIRVHAKHVGNAIVGDLRYGDNAVNTAFRHRGLTRLYLHAVKLEFPWQGNIISIESPPGAAWERALDELRGG